MVRFENLHKGEYISVVGYLKDLPEHPWGWSNPLAGAFNGQPFQILELSYPFIAVRNNQNEKSSLDFRFFELNKVSKQYADCFNHQPAVRQETFGKTEKVRKKKRRRPDPSLCPRCCGRMIQRLFVKPVVEWHKYCQECGLDAGPVDPGTGQISDGQ